MPLQLAEELAACGLPVFPCWDNKAPAVEDGLHSASTTLGDFWPSELVGVPVPAGIIIIDVDTHKGMDVYRIEKALGCTLDWDNSLLQHTPSGGAHYAFRVTRQLRQGSDLFHRDIGKGFDTRTNGRGYICAGAGYSTVGAFGLMVLAMPDSLPLLPESAHAALETPVHQEPTELPTGNRNTADIQAMLSYLDADCTRDEWMTVLRALRHHFHDDPDTGWTLFNNWSMTATGLDSQGRPMYDPATCAKDWRTTAAIPASGARPVTLGSLVPMAIEQGYVPSSTAAELFGMSEPGMVGAAQHTIETMLTMINSEGGNPNNLGRITDSIRNMQCSNIQREAMRATLQRVLKDHNLAITAAELKKACFPQQTIQVLSQVIASDSYFRDIKVMSNPGMSGDHRCNAEILVDSVFKQRLGRVDSDLFWWTGRYWERPGKTDVNAAVSAAFSQTGTGKTSNIDGTHKQLVNVVRRLPNINPASHKIFFRNGVLDLDTLTMTEHHADNFNGSTLYVDYTPGKLHPHWSAFLHSIFYAEPDRALLLQEIMGWCLITDNLNIQKAIALDGASRGGKGTIIDVMSGIIGQGMTAFTFGNLHSKKTLSKLRRYQVAVDSDAKRPDRKDATLVHSIFNRITANEPVDMEIIYQQETDVSRLDCKLMVACNGIPILADDSSAAPRRWIILKFTEDFTGREDHGLGSRLSTELPAIAAWAVEGLRRLMSNGFFTLPQSSLDATKEITQSSSPLLMFIEDRLEFEEGVQIPSQIMWDSFCNWCRDNNIRNNLNKPAFGRYMKQILIEHGARYHDKLPTTRVRGFVGCGLASSTEGVDNVTPITRTGQKFASEQFDKS